jgi:hypothetical protein
MKKEDSRTLNKTLRIDQARIQDHLGQLVRGSVEETLNDNGSITVQFAHQPWSIMPTAQVIFL